MRPIRQAVRDLLAALPGDATLPAHLDTALARLDGTGWPEVVTTWSRLTPSGFPVELTVGPGTRALRWAAEIAGPEVPEADRLSRVCALLAAHGQPVPAPLAAALRAVQEGCDLRFGGWVGGRDGPGSAPRLKLYAELPAAAGVAAELGPLLPPPIRTACRRLPGGTGWRMLGVEPARDRIELYLRLPALDLAGDLAPLLYAAGHAAALGALDHGLADGLRRLTGRRLGLSLAGSADGRLELALFVSARTLFPAGPELLAALAPQVSGLDQARWRPASVTLGLDPTGRSLPVAVGLCPARTRHRAAPGP